MRDNLIGYLLDALDPQTRGEVEEYLSANPGARGELELLRLALAPLEYDRAPPEPPAGLAYRAVRFAEEQAPLTLPRSPGGPGSRTLSLTDYVLRRTDFLIAACLALLLVGVALPWILHVRDLNSRVVCQNNLREIFTALHGYSGEHGGKYPSVHEVAGGPEKPHNVAGMVVPLLASAGYLKRQRCDLLCPGTTVSCDPVSYEDALKLSEGEFLKRAPGLTPCYGYSLGYREGGRHFGPACPGELRPVAAPLMADAPPKDPADGNSPNHGGRGQNVLYTDGVVKFAPTRHAGLGGDDIYLNQNREVKAGLGPDDCVIGESTARP